MRAIDVITNLLEHWGIKNVVEFTIHGNYEHEQVFLDVTILVTPPVVNDFGFFENEYKRFKLVEIEDGETTSSFADSSANDDAAGEEGSTL